jgi:hypothetical protein
MSHSSVPGDALQGRSAWSTTRLICESDPSVNTLNFVPLDQVEAFTEIMDRSFGAGACRVLNIRPEGAAELKL